MAATLLLTSKLPDTPNTAVFHPAHITHPITSSASSAIAYNAVRSTTYLEVRLSDREVVVYQGMTAIKRYRIGIGRPGWETPTGTFQIQQMKRNPSWINPFTSEKVAASDARNPLKGYWIGFWTDGNNWIGFHGTLNPSSVGRAASHGCIHMHSADLAELFSLVNVGTPVKVIQ